MMSNKWAFSLTSLITIFALAFVAAPASAQFEIELGVGADEDKSFADGNQVVYGAPTTIKIRSKKVVNRGDTEDSGTLVPATTATTGIEALDFTVIAYNKFGGTVTLDPVLAMLPVTVDGKADGMHFMADLPTVAAGSTITRVLIVLPKEVVELADPRAELDDAGKRKAAGKNKEASIELHFVAPTEGDALAGNDNTGYPVVHSIKRSDGMLRPVTAATFDVLITLSEEPRKDGFKKDKIDVSNATAADPVFLDKIDETRASAGSFTSGDIASSGRDMMVYRYIVTLTPKYEKKDDDIVVKVKEFYDQEKSPERKYTPPATPANYVEGKDMLTVKVGKEVLKDKEAGFEVVIDKEKRIPAGGYLVITRNTGGSGIENPPGSNKDEPKRHERSARQMLYNVHEEGTLPNLEQFLTNGGTIDLVGPAGAYISEIMWGSDASLSPDNNSQWIEIANSSSTASILTGENDKAHKLVFYGHNENLPDVSTVLDRVGTVGTGGYWSITGIGQPGRTGTGETAADVTAVVPTQALISMQRGMAADGTPADGTMQSSWTPSMAPALNFKTDNVGTRIATPGAAPIAYPATPAPTPEPTPDPVIPSATAADIMITEIMVDTGNGRLPQWIELTNVSGKEVSLADWSVLISNSTDDAEVVGESVSINLSGTIGVGGGENLGGTMGQSLVLVAGTARSSTNLLGTAVMDVSSQVGEKGRYKLISDMAFLIELIPPQKTGILTPGDTAGNLDAAEAWNIEMSENGRSSLIRREMDAAGMPTMGTDVNGWILASSTSLVSGPATWYGSDEDAGTPGYDAGGPLPVELSHFRPARDKATGAVVITWATESELNNAGFFIKRSNQRNGQFEVVNATMIPGAGTTSEKQFYTYTDTTAQPNVVYYYQIEDVSLDGNRQTLTRGIRLKGHVGAAGKATTTWGELKTSHE